MFELTPKQSKWIEEKCVLLILGWTVPSSVTKSLSYWQYAYIRTETLDVPVTFWMTGEGVLTNVIRQLDNLHVFFSDNTEGRENLDDLCHHVGLFGVDGSCQQQQAPLISQDPLQSILWAMTGRRWGGEKGWLGINNESICIHFR